MVAATKNVLQNGVNSLSKMVLKNLGFCPKPQIFVHFGPYDLVQIWPVCGLNTYLIMFRETLEFQCQHLQCVARKSFNGKFAAEIGFQIRHFMSFYVTITDPDIGSLKYLHTLFDKYLDHMLIKFEQNRTKYSKF